MSGPKALEGTQKNDVATWIANARTAGMFAALIAPTAKATAFEQLLRVMLGRATCIEQK